MRRIDHDPNSRLDYRWDWGHPDARGRSWLGDDDQISTANVTCSDPSMVVSNIDHDGSAVTAFIEGGAVGRTATVTCSIVTDAGRKDDRTIYLSVRER